VWGLGTSRELYRKKVARSKTREQIRKLGHGPEQMLGKILNPESPQKRLCHKLREGRRKNLRKSDWSQKVIAEDVDLTCYKVNTKRPFQQTGGERAGEVDYRRWAKHQSRLKRSLSFIFKGGENRQGATARREKGFED